MKPADRWAALDLDRIPSGAIYPAADTVRDALFFALAEPGAEDPIQGYLRALEADAFAVAEALAHPAVAMPPLATTLLARAAANIHRRIHTAIYLLTWCDAPPDERPEPSRGEGGAS